MILHNYPIQSAGAGLAVAGIMLSSTPAVVMGLFLVTIASLVQYLYPPIPAQAQQPPTNPLPITPQPLPIASPPPVPRKTYAEQDRAFAQGIAEYYCFQPSFANLYDTLRVVTMPTLTGKAETVLRPNEDMAKIQCNDTDTLYIFIRDQDLAFGDRYHLLSDVDGLKRVVFSGWDDLGELRYNVRRYRDFSEFIALNSGGGYTHESYDARDTQWHAQRVIWKELAHHMPYRHLPELVQSYLEEKVLSSRDIAEHLEDQFFSQVLQMPQGAVSFFDLPDVSEAVKARSPRAYIIPHLWREDRPAPHLFETQDFPPGTHIVRAFVYNHPYIGIRFPQRIAKIAHASRPHPDSRSEPRPSVIMSWFQTHDRDGNLLPRPKLEGYKTYYYPDFATLYASVSARSNNSSSSSAAVAEAI